MGVAPGALTPGQGQPWPVAAWGRCPIRPRVGRAEGCTEASGCGLRVRFAAPGAAAAAARGLREAGEGHKGARARRPTGRGCSAGAHRLPESAPAWLCRPAQPAGQPILRAREGLGVNGRAVLARLIVRGALLASWPFPAAERGKAGRRREDDARCSWIRRRLEPSGSAGSGRVGDQPGSACGASDWRSAQWCGGRAGQLICRPSLCVV